MTRTRAGTLALALTCLLLPAGRAEAAGQITWEKDLDAAQARARSQKKLVLQFFLIGNLGSPDC
ncbi:hypothetical protein HY251_01720 [bacterium]|nr:hypothetical protein [bacterium]